MSWIFKKIIRLGVVGLLSGLLWSAVRVQENMGTVRMLQRWREPGAANVSVLICICSSHRGTGGKWDRVHHLTRTIATILDTYEVPVHIIVDTDSPDLHALLPRHWVWSKLVRVAVAQNLENPLFLSWKHRDHVLAHLHEYSAFMYMEDDIEVPYFTYARYLENFRILWPERVPCLVRIERSGSREFCSDYRTPIPAAGTTFVRAGRTFASRPWGYSASWIMPAYGLRAVMDAASFTQLPPKEELLPREVAASYPWWGGQLGKQLGLELTGNSSEKVMVDRRSLVFHFSNSFINTGHKLVPLPDLIA
jgi:hypothetical protein